MSISRARCAFATFDGRGESTLGALASLCPERSGGTRLRLAPGPDNPETAALLKWAKRIA
jgi:hypothetical protein